jgi:hypothetical protein
MFDRFAAYRNLIAINRAEIRITLIAQHIDHRQLGGRKPYGHRVILHAGDYAIETAKRLCPFQGIGVHELKYPSILARGSIGYAAAEFSCESTVSFFRDNGDPCLRPPFADIYLP